MLCDDLDAPYAGAASAFCPSCGQPKGRGYGCAVLPEVAQERKLTWSPIGAYTEYCAGCELSDATHYHRPQMLADVDSGAVVSPNAPDAITIIRDALAQHADDPCECGPDHGAPSCAACYDRAALELVASLEGAVALAIEVLQHVNQWATFGSEGERFPWIAARTAEALAALEGR